MTRPDLIAAIAAVLFVAYLVGWASHWLVARLTRPHGAAAQSDLDGMAGALHDAEVARDQAIAARRQREQELTRRLKETQAELQAAMDGLGTARAETEDLRRELDRRGQA